MIRQMKERAGRGQGPDSRMGRRKVRTAVRVFKMQSLQALQAGYPGLARWGRKDGCWTLWVSATEGLGNKAAFCGKKRRKTGGSRTGDFVFVVRGILLGLGGCERGDFHWVFSGVD